MHRAFKEGDRGWRQVKNGEAREGEVIGEVPGMASMLGITCWACSPRAISGREGKDHREAQSTAGLIQGRLPGKRGHTGIAGDGI